MGAFDFTVGAILIGFALNMYLYGLVCYQYLAYKTVKFGDVIWLRSLVGVLFVIDTYQTIVEFYGVWYFAVENYTTPSVLGRVIWVTPLIGISTTISTFVFQGFLISRLFRFTSQFWLCSFLFLAAVAAFVLGVIDCTKAWLLVDVTKFSALIPLTIAWLAIEAGIDIIVAVILSRSLWRCKTGFTRTNTVINRCVRASIQSGLVSSVFAILNFLVFVLRSDTYLYAIFHWPLGRIYSNSLLYTLVARRDLAQIAYGTTEARDVGSSLFPTSPQITSIHFHKETVTDAHAVDDNVIPLKPIQEHDSAFPPPKTLNGPN